MSTIVDISQKGRDEKALWCQWRLQIKNPRQARIAKAASSMELKQLY